MIAPTIITRQGTPGRICGTASCFFLTALYLAIRFFEDRVKMNRRRGTSSLLLTAALFAAGCGAGDAPRPDLPASVSPGWTLRKMELSAPPGGLPAAGMPPVCWKANYASEGDATVWVCGYRQSASAFDAAQRMPSGASTVKFQQGVYLVVVQWSNVSQTGITVLVRAIGKSLPAT